MSFEAETEGFKELRDRMDRMGTRGKITLNEGLREIGHLFVPTKGTGPLAEATPWRMGKLARSTYFQIVGATSDQSLEIRQSARTPEGAFYGHFVREGTRPHRIEPKYKSVLKFIKDGREIFARWVNHPGTSPNPYHRRVYAQLADRVHDIIKGMGEDITAYLSGKKT